MVHTAESIRIKFFIDLLMESRKPLMLVGNAGVGKTMIIADKLASLPEHYAITNVPFNFYTTSGNVMFFNLEDVILELPSFEYHTKLNTE